MRRLSARWLAGPGPQPEGWLAGWLGPGPTRPAAFIHVVAMPAGLRLGRWGGCPPGRGCIQVLLLLLGRLLDGCWKRPGAVGAAFAVCSCRCCAAACWSAAAPLATGGPRAVQPAVASYWPRMKTVRCYSLAAAAAAWKISTCTGSEHLAATELSGHALPRGTEGLQQRGAGYMPPGTRVRLDHLPILVTTRTGAVGVGGILLDRLPAVLHVSIAA
jgi:hypothetical protein